MQMQNPYHMLYRIVQAQINKEQNYFFVNKI